MLAALAEKYFASKIFFSLAALAKRRKKYVISYADSYFFILFDGAFLSPLTIFFFFSEGGGSMMSVLASKKFGALVAHTNFSLFFGALHQKIAKNTAKTTEKLGTQKNYVFFAP